MQKQESTAKQASNRFYKYQNALQKKSLKIPKVCYDSEALILECGVYLDPPKYAMIKMHQFGIVVFIWIWGFYMGVMQVREWGEGALPRALE